MADVDSRVSVRRACRRTLAAMNSENWTRSPGSPVVGLRGRENGEGVRREGAARRSIAADGHLRSAL
jgi:hypothetical protein